MFEIRQALLACLLASPAAAQIAPGDVFREYVWRPAGNWARVVGDDAVWASARAFLPNPVYKVKLPDLAGATRVEVVIEKLTSHAGTIDPKLRVNGKAWLAIPEPPASRVPGTRGSLGATRDYLMLRYPRVTVPLKDLVQGSNTFEFACRRGESALGKFWPQFIVYGVVFRVFYGVAKPHPTGTITSPGAGSDVGLDQDFAVSASAPTGRTVARVDLIGDYDDFDWRGESKPGAWQFIYEYGAIRRHIGSSFGAPFKVKWRNAWVPSQFAPFRVVARIVDNTGMCFVTPPVGGLRLRRGRTVVRHLSTGIPKDWRSWGGKTHGCSANVTGPLSKAVAAKIKLVVWNGIDANRIGINGSTLASRTARRFDREWVELGVPLANVRPGPNTLFTQSNSKDHGIEVQWPGMELFVQYALPEFQATFVPFGTGCKGTNGTPVLSSTGSYKLGGRYTVDLANAKASSVYAIFNGLSHVRIANIPLPFDWSPFGATGCKQYTSLEFLLAGATDAQGKASFPYLVPNNPAFIGGSLFSQFLVLDPGANSFGWTFSNGGRAIFSDR